MNIKWGASWEKECDKCAGFLQGQGKLSPGWNCVNKGTGIWLEGCNTRNGGGCPTPRPTHSPTAKPVKNCEKGAPNSVWDKESFSPTGGDWHTCGERIIFLIGKGISEELTYNNVANEFPN